MSNRRRKWHTVKPKRGWYPLRLWTLLIVVLLSLPMGWLGVRVRQAAKNRRAAAEIQRVEGEIKSVGGYVEIWYEDRPNSLDSLFGDPGVFHVVQVSCLQRKEGTDAHLKHLKGLTGGVQILGLAGTQVADGGLIHLKGLTDLWNLDLRDTQVTGGGLEHLKGLASLRELNLSYMQALRRMFLKAGGSRNQRSFTRTPAVRR